MDICKNENYYKYLKDIGIDKNKPIKIKFSETKEDFIVLLVILEHIIKSISVIIVDNYY